MKVIQVMLMILEGDVLQARRQKEFGEAEGMLEYWNAMKDEAPLPSITRSEDVKVRQWPIGDRLLQPSRRQFRCSNWR